MGEKKKKGSMCPHNHRGLYQREHWLVISYSGSSAVSLGIKQGHIETQIPPLSSAIQTRKQQTQGSLSKEGLHTLVVRLPLKSNYILLQHFENVSLNLWAAELHHPHFHQNRLTYFCPVLRGTMCYSDTRSTGSEKRSLSSERCYVFRSPHISVG